MRPARFGWAYNLRRKGLAEGGGRWWRNLTQTSLYFLQTGSIRAPLYPRISLCGLGCGERRLKVTMPNQRGHRAVMVAHLGSPRLPHLHEQDAVKRLSGVGVFSIRLVANAPARRRGTGQAQKSSDKLVTSEASTSSDGGDSPAAEGTPGRLSYGSHAASRGRPLSAETICIWSASDGDA